MAPKLGFQYDQAAVDYLIETHYRASSARSAAASRATCCCRSRTTASTSGLPKRMTPEAFDFAVENYFSVM